MTAFRAFNSLAYFLRTFGIVRIKFCFQRQVQDHLFALFPGLNCPVAFLTNLDAVHITVKYKDGGRLYDL